MKPKTKEQLQALKLKIEAQISANQHDPQALVKLREDYREVCEKLSLFYDDIKEGATNE